MGEKLGNIGELHLRGTKYLLELNESGKNDREIHIQSENFRLLLPERIYMEAGANILLARKQLKLIKGMDEH